MNAKPATTRAAPVSVARWRPLWLALWVSVGSPACLLPSFEKVDAGKTDTDPDTTPDDEPDPRDELAGDVCGLSGELSVGCDGCIRENCCELAQDCVAGSDCGRDLLKPITPVSDVSTAFEPLLGCLQRECDAECDVSWGCVDNYEWPAPGAKNYTFAIRSIDFAAEPDDPLPNMEIRACQAVDPSCSTGLVDTKTTDEDGLALMNVPPRFDGYYLFSPAGDPVTDYLPTTVRWTEPVHRLDGFTHYGLTHVAVRGLGQITGELKGRDNFPSDAGYLIFRAQNCLPIRFITRAEYPTADAEGVYVEFDPDEGASRVYYTDESTIPIPSLMATTKDGLGGAFELPHQAINVQAYRADTMESIMGGRVRVDPGAIGFVYLMPRSR